MQGDNYDWVLELTYEGGTLTSFTQTAQDWDCEAKHPKRECGSSL